MIYCKLNQDGVFGSAKWYVRAFAPGLHPGTDCPGERAFVTATVLFSSFAAFEVLSKLPNHGIGAKLAKKTWQEGSFYTVTKIKLSQVDNKYFVVLVTLRKVH